MHIAQSSDTNLEKKKESTTSYVYSLRVFFIWNVKPNIFDSIHKGGYL